MLVTPISRKQADEQIGPALETRKIFGVYHPTKERPILRLMKNILKMIPTLAVLGASIAGMYFAGDTVSPADQTFGASLMRTLLRGAVGLFAFGLTMTVAEKTNFAETIYDLRKHKHKPSNGMIIEGAAVAKG